MKPQLLRCGKFSKPNIDLVDHLKWQQLSITQMFLEMLSPRVMVSYAFLRNLPTYWKNGLNVPIFLSVYRHRKL